MWSVTLTPMAEADAEGHPVSLPLGRKILKLFTFLY